MSATEVSGFDQYKKTCSIIFGNATQSQLRYLNASIELQQVLPLLVQLGRKSVKMD